MKEVILSSSFLKENGNSECFDYNETIYSKIIIDGFILGRIAEHNS
jgi:hypothetical protein